MSRKIHPSPAPLWALPTAVLTLAGLVFVAPALAQTASGDPSSAERRAADAVPVPPPTGEPPSARRENPGLINEIGKLLEPRPIPFPNLMPSLPTSSSPSREPAELADPPAETAPAPRASLPRLELKMPSMQKGRERCPTLDNGASDCKTAADILCRAHGYKEGKSTDTDATQKCSTEALLLSGRKSQPGACRTEYFVTRAWCQ
ncbi:MAG TPA: hypothetical protein VN130_06050 [Xanthobacteraceae bacterium]|nr:hypothetical protein [Xanthobacteraceae bacterium]